MKISSVACGFIKIDFYDYLKSLISRINEVYVFLCYSDILLKKKNNNINFIYNRLLCYNHTCFPYFCYCYCACMVSVT